MINPKICASKTKNFKCYRKFVNIEYLKYLNKKLITKIGLLKDKKFASIINKKKKKLFFFLIIMKI